ncbi:MAG TPA: hypothetical protein VGK72_04680 [Chthoniobacterales bacterium]|jgi:hypothetical protein
MKSILNEILLVLAVSLFWSLALPLVALAFPLVLLVEKLRALASRPPMPSLSAVIARTRTKSI